MRRPWTTKWAIAVALGAFGCGGSGDPAADTDGAGESETDGADDSGGSSGEPDMPGAECGDSPGRVGLHRLTRAEYNRTVRDLFGVDSEPANVLPPDPTTDGFDNNASSLGVDPTTATLLLEVAESVATDAMDGGVLPSCSEGDATCIDAELRALALRVYRRPATDAEIAGLANFVTAAEADGDGTDVGFRNAVMAMLMAPQFLYRSVPPTDTQAAAGDIVALDDYAVATRLSYFLWGSTPDDALLDLAASGDLGDRDVLRAEFDRMLADPKASALFEDFVAQWLQLGKLGDALPDPEVYPTFGEDLRDAMVAEVRLYLGGLRERDASVLDIVVGHETHANEALAEVYGIEGVSGETMVPVTTDPEQRSGVLTMPAILAMTSDPTRTNIVKRGFWRAENILCAAPPPPPDGIDALDDPQPGETERERLARHRTDPACASCHVLIDPLGFSLESYDALGRWRTEVDGMPVDNVGELPDGTQFTGAVELGAALEERFGACVSEKMMTFALGRAMGADDECRLDDIATRAATPEATIDDFLWTVVTSDAFMTEVAAEG